MAKTIIIIGIIITIVGIFFYFFGDSLKWIGNLPGDIKIEKENFKFYFPITTMILFSILFYVLRIIIHSINK
jgi:hypothetical protein